MDPKIEKEPLLQRILKENDVANREATELNIEKQLGYSTLIPLYQGKEGRVLIVYIANMRRNTSAINSADIAPIGSMLASIGTVDNLDLMLHSPGGSGLIAEKIVEMCREHTKKEFRVIVPNMAKSAATLISLGADEIVMGYCSELGPIDPQKSIIVNGIEQQISVISLINARQNLLTDIANARKKKTDYTGYLQQLTLSSADPAFIEECVREIHFATQLTAKWIARYMLKDSPLSREKLMEKITNISLNMSSLNDQDRFVHGKMIGSKEAQDIGLIINRLEKDSPVWNILWEIYLRSEVFLTKNSDISKLFFDKSNFLLV